MIHLNTNLFEELTGGKEAVLVEYHAPWCGYCTRLAPAVEKIRRSFPELVMGQINVDDEQELAAKEQIELVPTFVIYQNGEALGSLVAPESKAMIEEFILRTLDI